MAMGWQIFRVMFFLGSLFVDRSLGTCYSPLRFVIEQSLPQDVHSDLGASKTFWKDLEILHPTFPMLSKYSIICTIHPSPFVFVEMVWGCDSGVI